jgi:hypothetical protein
MTGEAGASVAVADPGGVWAYAIAEHADPAPLRDLTGIGGGSLHLVEGAGLTAVAGTVRLDQFGEKALRRNLEDLDWLEAVARAHHRVIEAVARQGPAVPMRLATVYRSDGSLAAMLEQRGSEFRDVLRRIGTRREWAVKAYAAAPAAPGSGRREPRGRPTTIGAGAAYLQRRRDELSAAKDAQRSAIASAHAVHDRLAQLAAQTRLHPPQAPQLTRTDAPMILNAAYLLDDADASSFTAAVAAVAEQHPGIRLELTGPWPPYSFAAADDQAPGDLQGGFYE